MCHVAFRHAKEAPYKGPTKTVLLLLADLASQRPETGKDGLLAWVSVEKLAKWGGMTGRSVQRSLTELKADRVIETDGETPVTIQTGTGKITVWLPLYRVNLPLAPKVITQNPATTEAPHATDQRHGEQPQPGPATVTPATGQTRQPASDQRPAPTGHRYPYGQAPSPFGPEIAQLLNRVSG